MAGKRKSIRRYDEGGPVSGQATNQSQSPRQDNSAANTPYSNQARQAQSQKQGSFRKGGMVRRKGKR